MNGILVITLGVVLLYLVISGKLDCLLKAIQACSGGAANSSTNQTNTVSTPAPISATPIGTLDTVLSSKV